MQKVDGFKVLEEIRLSHSTPVILLTAKDEEFERVYGLEIGADDYIPKPFSSRELLARVRARLRRENNLPQQHLLSHIHAGNLVVRIDLREVTYKDEPIKTTDTEFSFLALLAANKGQVVNKDIISEQVFKRPSHAFDRNIDMHVSNLRKKFTKLGAKDLIRTIRGLGYMLVEKDN